MNIASNLIFYCNNCDANRAFVTIRKSTAAAPSRPSGLLNAKFTFNGTSPTNHFRTDSQANECPTILSLTVFTQRNFVADFFKQSAILNGKRRFAFLSPLWGLGATYDAHLRLIGKRAVDFLLASIELFC